jgi:hypothetical protein
VVLPVPAAPSMEMIVVRSGVISAASASSSASSAPRPVKLAMSCGSWRRPG